MYFLNKMKMVHEDTEKSFPLYLCLLNKGSNNLPNYRLKFCCILENYHHMEMRHLVPFKLCTECCKAMGWSSKTQTL